MLKSKATFLSDEEKLQYFADLGGHDLDEYPVERTYKVYQGARFLVFHYSKSDVLQVDTTLLCTSLTADESGVKLTIVDRTRFGVTTIGDVVSKVFQYPVLCHIPYRCSMERTLKITDNDNLIQSIAGGVVFRSKSCASTRTPHHYYVAPVQVAKLHFRNGEYVSALARLNRRTEQCQTLARK